MIKGAVTVDVMSAWKLTKVDDLVPRQVMRWDGGVPLEVDQVEADWVTVHLRLLGHDGHAMEVDLPAGSCVEASDKRWLPELDSNQ